MKKPSNIFNIKLDDEEKEISIALNKGKPKSIDDLEKERMKAKNAAENFLRKDTRFSNQISN